MTMRYLMKGGYWKNSEDEILKAAVMKYGLNQWSRISSLIARKSAKQCKARWYEWLDPSIKKTEWTREEEEKLLHLAKIFPSQWRTIAPIVGRTPSQCLDHYERLLDQAQGRDEIDENDPRRLRPGEIDPTPEIRPARADAKDMDDDEKEMIAETRVRLANIKGKKAKRRAREKFIEKTRHLAQLQKQRELKAAGIEYVIEKKKKKKKIEIDYNAEIPFEHRPTETVFETGPEEEPAPNINIGNISLNTIEGVRRDEEEKRLRKLDQKKLKKLRTLNLPEQIEKMNRVNPLMYEKKTRLVLNPPQLTDRDLELLGKMTKTASETLTASTSDTTRELLGNYSVREPTPVKTPRYSSQLMKEALHAYNLQNPSPMAGGAAGLYADEVEDRKKTGTGATPNPYKQLISQSGTSRGETPLSIHSKKVVDRERTPLQHMYQDELSINNDEWADNNWEEGSQSGMGDPQTRYEKIRDMIKRSLENLPTPKNDYEIDLPELQLFVQKEKQLAEGTKGKMDLEDLQEMRADALEQQKLKDFYRQSQARQRGLPLPTQVPESLVSEFKSLERASSSSGNVPQTLVRKELLQMLVNDLVENPAGKVDVGALVPLYKKELTEEFDVDELERAEYLLEAERTKILQEKGVTEEEIERKFLDAFDKRSIEPTEAEKIVMLGELKKVKQALNSQITKLELEIQEALDEAKDEVLEAQITLAQQEIESKAIEVEIFERLREQENKSMLHRLHEEDMFIKRLKEKEASLQTIYRQYQKELAETAPPN
jgi:pre-mRNA-splicing factor CDC5/CEF1